MADTRRLHRNRSFVAGCTVFLIVLLGVFVLPWGLKRNPTEIRYTEILAPPTWQHPFGTDSLGRDLLARVMQGGQLSITIGAGTMALTALLGGGIGLCAGYFQRLDMPVMCLMDLLMSFPALVLALAILAVLGPGLVNVVIALTVAYTPRTARVVRSVVLSVREECYVEAAKAIGVPTWRILCRHILPACLPSLIVQESFVFAYAILGEAALSFVGVGIQPPTASWGNIIGDERAVVREAPWVVFSPGAAIAASVLALNLIGDGLREALDPRRRKIHT